MYKPAWNSKHKRNKEIYNDFKNGISYEDLCIKYSLSIKRIYTIVRCQKTIEEIKNKKLEDK